jgi:hypothetical protein
VRQASYWKPRFDQLDQAFILHLGIFPCQPPMKRLMDVKIYIAPKIQGKCVPRWRCAGVPT